MVLMDVPRPDPPAPANERRMNMNEKLTWTFAAVAAASGGAVFLTDRIEAAADPQTKRLLACALAFWVVLLVRLVTAYVWRLGARKAGVPRAAAVAPSKELGAPPARSRRRTAARQNS